MLKQVVTQWDLNKKNLEKYFKETPQSEYSSYEEILRQIIIHVLNDGTGSMNLNPEEISVVDDGQYQGTQIFLFHINEYQPNVEDYYWTNNFYGSCSGCDALLRISMYEDGLPNDEQIEEYMYLSLQMIQKIKKLYQE